MLREKLKNWIDIDLAAFELAQCLGIIEGKTFLETKWIYWSGNKTGDFLYKMLDELVKTEILEKRDEPDLQYRWNKKFEPK